MPCSNIWNIFVFWIRVLYCRHQRSAATCYLQLQEIILYFLTCSRHPVRAPPSSLFADTVHICGHTTEGRYNTPPLPPPPPRITTTIRPQMQAAASRFHRNIRCALYSVTFRISDVLSYAEVEVQTISTKFCTDVIRFRHLVPPKEGSNTRKYMK